MWPQECPDPEPDGLDDIQERYAGERIPPFDNNPDLDPWTGVPYPEAG